MTEAHVTPAGSGAIPYLTIPSGGGQAAVDFYRLAFAAEEIFRTLADDGERVMHSRLMINGGLVFLSDEFPEYGGATDTAPVGVVLHLQVEDADAWWSRALIAGCVPLTPLADQFWGDRYGRMRDPFGHVWSVGSPSPKAV